MPDLDWCRKGGSRGYVTTRPVVWPIGRKGSYWLHDIPAGTELSNSVPAFLHGVFSPDDPYFLKSALIHDTLLEAGCRRAFADSQWFEAALSEKAPRLRCWTAYRLMRARRFVLWATGREKLRV